MAVLIPYQALEEWLEWEKNVWATIDRIKYQHIHVNPNDIVKQKNEDETEKTDIYSEGRSTLKTENSKRAYPSPSSMSTMGRSKRVKVEVEIPTRKRTRTMTSTQPTVSTGAFTGTYMETPMRQVKHERPCAGDSLCAPRSRS